jgi:hypothetical protein
MTGPQFAVSDHDGAVRDFVKDTGVAFVRAPRLEVLEAMKTVTGADTRAAFAETTLNGKPAVLFIYINQQQGSKEFGITAVEMPRETFAAWGAAARFTLFSGFVPSVDAFPEKTRTYLKTASMDQQIAFYEAVQDKYAEIQMANLMMSSQAQLLNGMRQLNYDMLFDKDFSTSAVEP